MKRLVLLTLIISVFLFSPTTSECATYSFVDDFWGEYFHWDDILYEWDPQRQIWSNSIVQGNTGGFISNMNFIISSDGAIGKPVYVELTFAFSVYGGIGAMEDSSNFFQLNPNNFAGADNIDIWQNFEFYAESADDNASAQLLHQNSSGTITLGLYAKTGDAIDTGILWASADIMGCNNIDVSGMHLYDNDLETKIIFGAMSLVSASGYKITPVPEPTSMLLLGLGLAGIAGFRKRMK
jgi:hypothetical protein